MFFYLKAFFVVFGDDFVMVLYVFSCITDGNSSEEMVADVWDLNWHVFLNELVWSSLASLKNSDSKVWFLNWFRTVWNVCVCVMQLEQIIHIIFLKFCIDLNLSIIYFVLFYFIDDDWLMGFFYFRDFLHSFLNIRFFLQFVILFIFCLFLLDRYCS